MLIPYNVIQIGKKEEITEIRIEFPGYKLSNIINEFVNICEGKLQNLGQNLEIRNYEDKIAIYKGDIMINFKSFLYELMGFYLNSLEIELSNIFKVLMFGELYKGNSTFEITIILKTNTKYLNNIIEIILNNLMKQEYYKFILDSYEPEYLSYFQYIYFYGKSQNKYLNTWFEEYINKNCDCE